MPSKYLTRLSTSAILQPERILIKLDIILRSHNFCNVSLHILPVLTNLILKQAFLEVYNLFESNYKNQVFTTVLTPFHTYTAFPCVNNPLNTEPN